jgi:hypothetical protein
MVEKAAGPLIFMSRKSRCVKDERNLQLLNWAIRINVG